MGSAEREMLNHMGTKILEKNDGESIAVKNKFYLPMIAWIKCAISQKCGVKIIALNDEESVAIKNI